MSKKITLGKVSLTPRGRWSPDVVYENLDVVLYEGSAWIARGVSVGQLPSEESRYWKIAVEGIEADKEKNILAFLPDRIYAAQGVTLEIYNRQVCPDAEKYHFKWTCSVGRAYGRKFTVTPTYAQSGSYPLRLDIADDEGNIVWSKEVELIARGLEFWGTKTICPIGAMHTDSKAWIDEIKTNLSDGQIEFTGTLGSSAGQQHEGRTGWTTQTYLTMPEEYNTDTEAIMQNPFWDGERFSWGHFVDMNDQFCDAVQLFFGEKEILNEDTEVLVNNLMQLIGRIKEESVDMPIFVVLPPCPGTQDGIAKLVTSEYRSFNGLCKYEIDTLYIKTAKRIYEAVVDSEYENIFFVPLTQCFDSENNYPTISEKLNPRNTTTVKIQSNALKPTESGYRQMADVMLGAYLGLWG